MLSPTERILRARVAAHAMHSKNDSRVTSAPGRAAFLRKFEDVVDHDRTLPESERLRRAEHARKAYFGALALKSAKVRRVRKAAER